MFKATDPYSFSKYCDLLSRVMEGDEESFETIGQVYMDYRVSKFDNLRLQGAEAVQKTPDRQYIVECLQRINIWNEDGMITKPEETVAYEDYPVFVQALMKAEQIPGITVELLEYSPQTVNTQVNTTSNAGTTEGSHAGTSSSQTSGSSHTGTMTYDLTMHEEGSAGISSQGISLGASGGMSEHIGYMSADTVEHSSTQGSEFARNRSRENSSSVSMSMKDWGAYAMVDPAVKSPVWSFGQEYPWDVFNCRKSTGEVSGDQVKIDLPESTALRLYSESNLYPPSQLSLYGINFITKAKWLITIEDTDNEEVTLHHFLTLLKATHKVETTGSGDNTTDQVALYVDRVATSPIVPEGQSLDTTLDLSLMAIDPIGAYKHSAIVGFVPNKFTVKPSPVTDSGPAMPFKLVASSNTMLVKDTTDYTGYPAGTGFEASLTSLNASFTDNAHPLTMTLYFKIPDADSDYTLYLKHWKKDKDIRLTFTINGDEENSITKYVDALEAEGGENNLLAIALRDLNYASVNYHDYLKLGLNKIEVRIEPEEEGPAAYQVRAASIEKA